MVDTEPIQTAHPVSDDALSQRTCGYGNFVKKQYTYTAARIFVVNEVLHLAQN